MPIECDIEIIAVSQDKFHQLERSVMRHAFDIHNSMGRFCDEGIYQDELASRCSSSGFESVREVEIRLIHRSFSKSYFAAGLLPVAIKTQDRIIGTQKMCLLTPETAWQLSAVKSNLASHEKHIRRLLAHTSLNCLHWINLNQNDVHLRTIQNDSVIK